MTARNFLPLPSSAFVVRTRMHFALVQNIFFFGFRLSHRLIGTIDHQLWWYSSCFVMCSRHLWRRTIFNYSRVLSIQFCNYSSHRGDKNTYWNAVNNNILNKGSSGSTVVVGAWVACEHAKQQLATICVTICLSVFYLSFESGRNGWHLIFIIEFSYSIWRVRLRISYSIWIGCQRTIRQSN